MIASHTIRLATRADAAQIAALSRDEIERGLPWRWRPQKIIAAMQNRNTNVVVAVAEEACAGFGIMEYGDERAYLALFAVQRAAQRHGIGRAMLNWLERVAIDAGITTSALSVRADNVTALAFYHAHGYSTHTHKPRMYDGQIDGLHLQKVLARHV